MLQGTTRVVLLASLGLFGCGAEGGGIGGPGGVGSNGGTGTGGKGGAAGRGPDGGLAGEYFPDQLKPGAGTGKGNGETPCEVKKFNLDRSPPELMLVLDRSGSMQRDAAGRRPSDGNFMAPTRWTATVTALDEVLQMTQAGVSWGLQMFPFPKTTTQTDPLACKGDAPPTNEPAFNAHGAIMATVNDSAPPLDIGTTPTRAAIAATTEYLKSRTTTNPKYILLATDGEPNECSNPDDPATVRSPTGNAAATVQAVQAASAAGFPVFVVGLAVGASANTMNQLAVAGGRPKDGDTKFYSVTSSAELRTALLAIASAVSDCTFQLGDAPPAPDEVAVDVGSMRVSRDPTHANGWDYGDAEKKTIVLYGPICEDVKSGKVKEAGISWTCPGVPIP